MARKRKDRPAGETALPVGNGEVSGVAKTVESASATPQFLEGSGYLQERAAIDPRKEDEETSTPEGASFGEKKDF